MKYVRLIWEMEVEVTDLTATKTHNFDVTADGQMLNASDGESVARAVTDAALHGLRERESEIGVKWMSGAAIARPTNADGYYLSATISEMPGR